MQKEIINKILKKNKDIDLEKTLKILFKNKDLKNFYVNEIRRYSVIWEITNKILKEKNSKQRCKILAIWDIKYYWEIEKTWIELMEKSIKNIKAKDLLWYDLSWLWTDDFRESLYRYSDLYYNLSSHFDKEKIVSEIIPCYWATDWFSTALDTLKDLYKDKNISFIYPEASFLANVKIAENILEVKNTIKINKSSKENYFLDKNQIDNIKKSENNINIYYITPVWNPTWEALDNKKLYEILSHISKTDKNSIILMDNVYVWLLKNTEAKNMFENIFSNQELINKIVFIESLSKTLWTTGIRLGYTWTLNKYLSQNIKKKVVLKKAWFSKVLANLVINLFSDLDKIIDFQDKVYDFFAKQRLGFLEYIRENHSEFFDFDYLPKILDREWIYLLLKLKKSVESEEVFIKTWIIWVKIELSDWIYIRYAFWNVDYF